LSSLTSLFWSWHRESSLAGLDEWLLSSGPGRLLVHAVLEGVRWQMIPAYLVCGGLGIYCLTDLKQSQSSESGGEHSGDDLAVEFSCTGDHASRVLPPSTRRVLRDSTVTRRWTRNAVEASGQPSSRILTVQFWYPTEVRKGKRSLYRTEDAEGLKSHLRLV